ncbi:MAG: MTAP family purine nucleoside phosphorylase [Candidatus Woesearchaeota archaeon]
MIGVIGGSSLLEAQIFPDCKPKKVKTEYGDVEVFISKKMCFLQRHGKGIPPHKINHKANISALKQMGVDRILAVSSTGSMNRKLKPGDLVVIDDYMQMSGIPTFYDSTIRFTPPKIDEKLSQMLVMAAADRGILVHKKGVYLQTQGPRFETKAEIRMFSRFADVVGMTVASEATLANEAGIPYACICSVDNYANGIGEDIGWEKIVAIQKKTIAIIKTIVLEAVRRI